MAEKLLTKSRFKLILKILKSVLIPEVSWIYQIN